MISSKFTFVPICVPTTTCVCRCVQDIEGGLFGELPARTKKPLTLNFTPQAADFHAMKLVCSVSVSSDMRHDPSRLLDGPGVDPSASLALQVSEQVANQDGPQSLSCNITAAAGLPHFAFTDVRMFQTPLSAAWEQFHVDAINLELSRALSPYEEHVREAEKQQKTQSAQELYQHLPGAVLNYGMGLYGTSPSICFFKVQNLGDLEAEWVIKFPEDLEVERELWTDPLPSSAQQAALDVIRDNSLFSVRPRRGKLGPGQSQVIQSAYFHRVNGSHELPVVFQVVSGKQMVFFLRGQTLDGLAQTFSILENEHALQSVPIGLTEAQTPLQHYRLNNPTDWDLQYVVDTSNFEEVRYQNHNTDVFWCPEVRGVVPAHGYTDIPLYFRPLEAKTYRAALMLTRLPQVASPSASPGMGFSLPSSPMPGSSSSVQLISVSSTATFPGTASQDPAHPPSVTVWLTATGLHPTTDVLPYCSASSLYPASMVHAEAEVRETSLPAVAVTTLALAPPRPSPAKGAAAGGEKGPVSEVRSGDDYSRGEWMPLGVHPRGGQLPRFPTDQWAGPWPGQAAELSTSVVDFGVLPLRGINRRVLTVRNRSSRPISFSWEIMGEVITIEPRMGVVAPHQKALCRVTLRAFDAAVLLDRNVVCTVGWHVEEPEVKGEKQTSSSTASRSQTTAGPLQTRSNNLSQAVSQTMVLGMDSRLNSRNPAYSGKAPISEATNWVGTGQFSVMAPLKTYSNSNSDRSHHQSAMQSRMLLTRQSSSNIIGTAVSATGSPPRTTGTATATANATHAMTKSRLFAPSTQHVKPAEVDLASIMEQTETWFLHLRVRAHILYPEQVRQLADGDDVLARYFGMPQPMALPDAAPKAQFDASEAKLAGVSESDAVFLYDLMARLLQDVVHAPPIRSALETLGPEPVPYFVHLPTQVDPLREAAHPLTDPAVRAKCLSHDLIVPADAATPLPTPPVVPSALTAEYQVWSESVLDGVVYSLLQEAVAGEFKLTAAVAKKSH